jgi:chromosome segregation ATPase
MTFDVGIKFSVETQELINARNALHSLAQAAKDLNNNQEKAATKTEALKQAVSDTSAAAEKAEKNVTKLNESTNETASSADKVERRLSILKDQVGYLNGTLEQSQTGFTRM